MTPPHFDPPRQNAPLFTYPENNVKCLDTTPFRPLIIATGWQWIDPAISLAIAAVIIFGTWGLLRDSVNLALQAVPQGIDVGEVRRYLSGLPHVTAVHDLHVWPMSTTETALTAHLVRDVDDCDCALLEQASRDLQRKFEIQHATLQFETQDNRCHLAPEEKV